MKRIIAAIVCIVMMLPVSANGYNIDGELSLFNENTSDAVVSTIEQMNAVRNHLSLPQISANEKLKIMAQTHSKYMAYSKSLTSIEESGKDFYRGRYPWDRASYFDYDKDYIYEFVKKDCINYQNGVNALIADPVTRTFMLNPMYTDIGMAVWDTYFTFELGGNASDLELFVNYPYSTQKDVPVKWHGDSFDTLYGDTNLASEEVGTPITVTYYGEEDVASVSNVDIILMNADKNDRVPFELVMPGDYYLLENTLTVLPLEAYDYDTTYQVHIRIDIKLTNGQTKSSSKIYSFTTEASNKTSVSSPYITRGEFTEKLVKSFDYTLIEPLEYKFTDVDLTSSEGIYIYTASTMGLINGLTENKFRPELNITREQAYVIFVRAYEKGSSGTRLILITDDDALEPYDDSDSISEWAYNFMLKAMELGIVTSEDNELHPGEYLTEDDFNTMLKLYKNNTEDI